MVSSGKDFEDHLVQPLCFTDDKTEVLSGVGTCPRSFSKLAESRSRIRSSSTLIFSTLNILNIPDLDQEIRKED